MVMVRKQLYLPAKLDKELAEEASRRGVSQAELIRIRLEGRDTATRHTRTSAEDSRRQEAVNALREVRSRIKPGPGTGRKFNREEVYAERLDRISRR
jgi:hypothetical protein